jgi:tetratricopeptide (TPR) repeat protein
MVALVNEPEEVVEQALDRGDPAAMAVAFGLAGSSDRNERIDAKLEAFLDRQSTLVELQTAQITAQRHLHLAHLRTRHWRDRAALAMQGLALIVGAVAVVGLVVLIWQARQDNGLVVEPFSVPPDMAQRGVTGEVMAAKLMDRLNAMQAQTDSARAPDSITKNWGDDIKLEIPSTGVSIGEINSYLRQWLGHQTRVSGELLRSPTGFSLTVRAAGSEGQTVQGSDTDLDGLMGLGAEAVYRQTQPYRYGVYLRGRGRTAEAMPVFAQLAASGPPGERSWGYVGLGNAVRILKGPDQALVLMRTAARMTPAMYSARQNIGDIEGELGQLEASLADRRAALKLLDAPGNGSVLKELVATTRDRMQSSIDMETGDYSAAVRRRTSVVAFGKQAYLGSVSALLVGADVGAHDLTAAQSALRLEDESSISPGRSTWDNIRAAMQIASAREDWPAVLAGQAQADQLLVQWPGLEKEMLTRAGPMVAHAKAMMGDLPDAEVLIASTPADCDSCLRERGKLAAMRREWSAAELWFAEAARRAPSIPFAYTDWGQMLLARGDVDGAIAKLQIAHQKGPYFADPLELWGEALMRKGDFAGASAKFAEADRYAPRWGHNHLRWSQALARQGRADEAQAQRIMAAAMDLSAQDQAELARAPVATATAR